MGTFDYLQRKSPLASTPALPVPSLLRPSRPFAPLSPPYSEQGTPVTRAPLEHGGSLEYSFDRIPIFPPAKKNTTGLPDALKTSVENLSGMSLEDVRVHYSSSQPGQVQALAYTRGSDIHVAPGQEKHLAHEAWHVVQQKQGRVTPTVHAWGQAINDDQGLEQEADSMAKKAASAANVTPVSRVKRLEDATGQAKRTPVPETIQRRGRGPNILESDPRLVAAYEDLMRSEEFRKMDELATSHQAIILKDSTRTQETSYDSRTHKIRVPLRTREGAPRSLSDIRENILWEMHNALNRGAHKRSKLKLTVPRPGPNATPEEMELYPYTRAAKALSMEWDEWIRIPEHQMRTAAINQDPAVTGALGPNPVTAPYAQAFLPHPEGYEWYEFVMYLGWMIHRGHTTGYDPDAANPDWVGMQIVKEVRRQRPNSLILMNREVIAWRIGKTKHVKDEAINPFKTRKIIEDARRRRDD